MITPHEVLAELTQLDYGIDNGTFLRNEVTRRRAKTLGNLIRVLERYARDHRNPAATSLDDETLQVVIREARRIHGNIVEKLNQPTH